MSEAFSERDVTNPSSGFRTDGAASGALMPPAAAWMLAGSATVATAAWLGLDWMKQPAHGVPIGLWLIGIAGLAAMAVEHRRRANGGLLAAATKGSHASDSASVMDANLSEWTDRALWTIRRPFVRRFNGETRVSQIERERAARIDREPTRGKALRFGLDVPAKAALALAHAAKEHVLSPFEIVPIDLSENTDQACEHHDLDALVRVNAEHRYEIVTREGDGHEAALFDWAVSPPVSYASTFPARVDPYRITLDEVSQVGDEDHEYWSLVAGALASAACLARSAPRLTLHDRLQGRRVMVGYPAYAVPSNVSIPAAEAELLSLARIAERLHTSGRESEALRAVLRGLAGWVCVADSWTDSRLRRQIVEAAAERTPDEAAAHLRLAAVRLAEGEDVLGFEALFKADKLLRAGAPVVPMDHLAFVQSEIDLGQDGPMTLGRVAAGLSLACAEIDDHRLEYVSEDVMDDARYASWLTGRDQDAALLRSVFRMIRHARAAHAMGKAA